MTFKTVFTYKGKVTRTSFTGNLFSALLIRFFWSSNIVTLGGNRTGGYIVTDTEIKADKRKLTFHWR